MKLTQPLSLLLATLLMTVGTSHSALVAHYTFDEGSGTTAADSAGGDQNATTNQGTVGWAAAGVIGGALDLPGSASMQAPDAIGAGATAFTLSAWVNMDDTPRYDGIFETRAENWGLNVEGGSLANLHIDFRYDNPPVGSGGSIGVDSANGSIGTGTWHHIAMTWDNSGAGNMFVDGMLVQSSTGLTTLYSAGGQMWNIGDDSCCGGRELDAQLDDLAVWDEALSASQISQIYNGGLAGMDAPTSLIPEPTTGILALFGLLLAVRRRR